MRPFPAWLLWAVGALAGSPPSAAEMSSDAPKDPRGTPAGEEAAPPVAFTLTAPSARGPWTMHLANTSDEPMTVVADPRLLVIDVIPRGAQQPVRCELPWVMRPVDDLQRAMVLPPGGTYDETFEPRLFCFASLGALAAESIVVARLGWPGARRGPSVVWPVASGPGSPKPLRSLTAPPVRLPDEPVPPPSTPTTLTPSGDLTPRLSLLSPASIDAPSSEDLVLPITLRNEGSSPVIVRFRPESLGFDVSAPGVFEHCAWPVPAAAATRELFTTLPPNGSETLTVVLTAYCSGHSLDQAGLLSVRPWLDTRNGSGAALGLRTFNGLLVGTRSTLVRLQNARAPDFVPAPRSSPAAAPIQRLSPRPSIRH
jgi:hypothetical protein